MIPIIEILLKRGNKVVVAGDVQSLELIKLRFSNIQTVDFKSYGVRLSAGNNQFWPMLWLALRLPLFNMREHRELDRLITRYNIDVVISDNRYGVWSKRCKSIIITHQLRVIPPNPFAWASCITESIIKRWLRKFNRVLVPDFENNFLAGKLSASNGLNTLGYIGPLSRFNKIEAINASFGLFQMVVVVSGPEPHRSMFVQIASELAVKHRLSCLIIEGKPQFGIIPRSKNGVWLVGHLSDSMFTLAVTNAEYLLFRAGYSSIMDILALGVSGLMVPTPGQTEQEYIAQHLAAKGYFNTESQKNLANVDIEKMRSRKCECQPTTDLELSIVSAID